MNKFILTVAVLAVCTTSLLAQSFGASSVLLRAPGSAFSVTLNPPALTGNHTFTFPNASGTLLVSADLATSAWTLGGNSLIAPGPTTNVLGTTSAHDVVMTAGGLPATNTRLTLLSGSNAVQTGPGTELRLLNPLGTNHSSFKAGTQIANIEYILPTTGPTVANQVLRATNTGNPVVLEWATVSGGGGGGSGGTPTSTITLGADADETAGTFTTVAGLNFAVTANTSYSFYYTIDARKTGGSSAQATYRLQFPAGSIVSYSFSDGTTTASVNGANATPLTTVLLAGSTTVTLTGTVIVGGTGGNLSVQQRLAAGANGVRMQGSTTQLILY